MAQRASATAFAQAQAAEFETETGTIYYDLLGVDTRDENEDAATDKNAAANSAPKPWITLLHNFMSTGRTAWSQVAPRLAETHRVLVPDLPGHGRSQGYPPHFSYRAMAEQIAALMTHLSAEAGHLAGASAGGMVAQWLVAEKWARPASLTLISTTHSMNPETAGAPVETDPDRFRFGGNWLDATAALHDPHHDDGYFRRELLPAAGKRKLEHALDLPLAALEDWPMPVCIIHGEDDEFFPVEVARNMAAHLPAAQLHVIPGQSHALIFRQGWKIADLLAEFLNDNQSG